MPNTRIQAYHIHMPHNETLQSGHGEVTRDMHRALHLYLAQIILKLSPCASFSKAILGILDCKCLNEGFGFNATSTQHL